MSEDADDAELGFCRVCGAPNDDGEGYDGLCGGCADRLDLEEEGDDAADVCTDFHVEWRVDVSGVLTKLDAALEALRILKEQIATMSPGPIFNVIDESGADEAIDLTEYPDEVRTVDEHSGRFTLDEEGQQVCSNPKGHFWVVRDDNEEISYCEWCGADGNA